MKITMKIRQKIKVTVASIKAIQLKLNIYITMIKFVFTLIEVTKMLMALVIA